MTLDRKLLLIDADTILYKSAFAVEKEVCWGGDTWILFSDLADAMDVFREEVSTIRRAFPDDFEFLLCYSSDSNFRKLLLPSYKANRKKTRKPIVFKPLKEWAFKAYPTLVKPNIEADDILGICSNEGVMVSIDKDLKTVAGTHYNPNHPEDGVYEVTEEEAHYNHMTQTLCGDSTDGYKGCPSIGEKTSAKLLDVPVEDMWGVVKETYKKKGISEKDLIVQARVARILRGNEYNWTTCKLNLWSPEDGET